MKFNLSLRFLFTVAVILIISKPLFSEDEIIEEIINEPRVIQRASIFKIHLSTGLMYPWAQLKLGIGGQADIQLKLFKRIIAEFGVGYRSWSSNLQSGPYADANTSVISIVSSAKYKFANMRMKEINGHKQPTFSLSGIAGIHYNIESWDLPNSDTILENASYFGVNLGLGIDYHLLKMFGKPVDLDMRFIEGIFTINNNVQGSAISPQSNKLHWEYGLLLGIAYPI